METGAGQDLSVDHLVTLRLVNRSDDNCYGLLPQWSSLLKSRRVPTKLREVYETLEV